MTSDSQQQTVVNNLLTDKTETSLYEPIGLEIFENPSYVEYYFDLRLDSEIPEEDVCNGLLHLKTREIFIDLDINCIERDDIEIDTYASRVTDIEEC